MSANLCVHCPQNRLHSDMTPACLMGLLPSHTRPSPCPGPTGDVDYISVCLICPKNLETFALLEIFIHVQWVLDAVMVIFRSPGANLVLVPKQAAMMNCLIIHFYLC